MATIKLIPSTSAVSNSSYVSITNANNMYTNIDSTTYASLRNSRNSTSNTYYVYLRGFNFDDVPSGATVNSFTIRIRGYETNLSTSSSYRMSLYNNTTAISNTTATASLSTTATTFTFPNGNLTWDTLKRYGANFGIRIPLRRSSTNSNSYAYIYGAEIEVDYTPPGFIVTAISNTNRATIEPTVVTVPSGSSQEFRIDLNTSSINEITVTDNDVDVTNQLVEHQEGGPGTVSSVPGSAVTTGFTDSGGAFYQSSSSSTDAWLRYAIGYSAESPYSTSNTSNTYVKGSASGNTCTGWMNYPFDFSDIPSSATITSMSVKLYGARESETINSTHVCHVGLYSGNVLKSTQQNLTSTSNSIVTISNPGTWTVNELQDAQLRFTIGYYGGRILGATWTVNYTVPPDTYYTYTLNQVAGPHEIVIEEKGAFVPPEEDPTKIYYPITISAINATTEPVEGTTRVESGSNQTIIIHPEDPQLTLALDNGVDITNQLVGGVPNNTYTITTQVSGASYGFNLNNSTGYYVSTNDGVARSASVARINMDFDSSCLVTITYINYAEANYDYGMFGKLDTAVATDGLTASSNSSSPSDSTSNYEIPMCTNSSSTQTVTYQVPAGQHFIDVKYGKDDASNSNNDSLQWKVTSVEATSAGGDYTYTLTNVNQKHSLIFVFGNVNYYFITANGTNSKLFPDGQVVKLEGDSYRLVIIPNDINAQVTITDNNINRTNLLTTETGQDKNGNPVINYIYELSNINAAHNLVITCINSSVTTKIFFKNNNTWTAYSKVYQKVNGVWVEQSPDSWSRLFDTTQNYKIIT